MNIKCSPSYITLSAMFVMINPKITNQEIYVFGNKYFEDKGSGLTPGVELLNLDQKFHSVGHIRSRRSVIELLDAVKARSEVKVNAKRKVTKKKIKKKLKHDSKEDFYKDDGMLQHHRYRPSSKLALEHKKHVLVLNGVDGTDKKTGNESSISNATEKVHRNKHFRLGSSILDFSENPLNARLGAKFQNIKKEKINKHNYYHSEEDFYMDDFIDMLQHYRPRPRPNKLKKPKRKFLVARAELLENSRKSRTESKSRVTKKDPGNEIKNKHKSYHSDEDFYKDDGPLQHHKYRPVASRPLGLAHIIEIDSLNKSKKVKLYAKFKVTKKVTEEKFKNSNKEDFYEDDGSLQHHRYRPMPHKLKYSPRKKLLKANMVSGSRKFEPGFNFTEEEMEKFKLWRNGIILYFIDEYSFDFIMRQKLRLILNSFNELTGLLFTELPSPPDDKKERWVMFINRREALSCEDYTTISFTNTGVQRVVLGYDCLGSGAGALGATVLALAGVPPQHNAPDRDIYINVIMDNILPEKRELFEILRDDEWLFHDIEYDFLSAGHYDLFKYTLNGSATIAPKMKENEALQIPRNQLSPIDIKKIRMLYNYISLNRRKANKDDCSKIFKPANNLGNYRPMKEKKVNAIPRDKPQKYLALVTKNKENQNPGRSSGNKIQKLAAKLTNPRNFNKSKYFNDTIQLSSMTTPDPAKKRKLRTKNLDMLKSVTGSEFKL